MQSLPSLSGKAVKTQLFTVCSGLDMCHVAIRYFWYNANVLLVVNDRPGQLVSYSLWLADQIVHLLACNLISISNEFSIDSQIDT